MGVGQHLRRRQRRGQGRGIGLQERQTRQCRAPIGQEHSAEQWHAGAAPAGTRDCKRVAQLRLGCVARGPEHRILLRRHARPPRRVAAEVTPRAHRQRHRQGRQRQAGRRRGKENAGNGRRAPAPPRHVLAPATTLRYAPLVHPDPTDLTAPTDRRAPATFSWQALFFKLLLVGSALFLLIWLIFRLQVVTTPILIGFFIAYALNPAVLRLRRWRVPAFLALTVPVLAVVSLAVLFAVVVLPALAQEVIRASQHAPARIYNWVLSADPWFKDHIGRPLSSFIEYRNLSGLVQSVAFEAFGPARSALGWVLTSVRDVLLALGNLVLVLVVAFFLLEDYGRIVTGLGELVPRRDLPEVRRIVGRIDEVLAGFLRGELVLLVTATAVYTVGLVLLDVPFAVVVG
ncbi:MAG: AI-2E family transporter, partial [Myxococcales bacterium]|nr:AI-2E family transporter [Myxococcales bacterium]